METLLEIQKMELFKIQPLLLQKLKIKYFNPILKELDTLRDLKEWTLLKKIESLLQ